MGGDTTGDPVEAERAAGAGGPLLPVPAPEQVAEPAPAEPPPPAAPPKPVELRGALAVLLGLVIVLGPMALLRLVDAFVAHHPARASTWPWWQQVGLYAGSMVGIVVAGGLLLNAALVLTAEKASESPRSKRRILLPMVADRAWTLLVLLATVMLAWSSARLSSWSWVLVGPVFAGASAALTVSGFARTKRQRPLEQLADPRALAILAEVSREPQQITSTWLARSSVWGTRMHGLVHHHGWSGRALVLAEPSLDTPDPELRALLAHEVAHVELGHLQGRALAQALAQGVAAVVAMAAGPHGPWVSLAAAQVNEPPSTPVHALPLLVINVLGAFFIARLVLWFALLAPYIHRQEVAADAFALDRTGDPAGFIALIERISPPRKGRAIGATHPSTQERVAMARRWAATRGIDLAAT